MVSRLSSYASAQPQSELELLGWVRPDSSLNHCRYSAQLAFKILDYVIAQPLAKPVFLGSEWEMAEQYNYSLEVVRQASRILEDMGVIESRLGRNGGLFTRKPGEKEVSPQIFAYFAKQRVALSDAVDVLTAIEQQMSSEGVKDVAANPILDLFASMLKAYAGRAQSSNNV
ncbi:Rrf2 family transcriptional regulator [Methylocella silvestris]|uniref:Rrf2 family transcriptional regulator n=1 Tax=Methylocella silvestris TaxID=199596 RepID=UPI0011AEF029|nr:Rrf2 family transcriptional regulator [Methylocella silvestris]